MGGLHLVLLRKYGGKSLGRDREVPHVGAGREGLGLDGRLVREDGRLARPRDDRLARRVEALEALDVEPEDRERDSRHVERGDESVKNTRAK